MNKNDTSPSSETARAPAATARPGRLRRLAPWFIIIASTTGVALYKYDESSRPRLDLGPMVQIPAANELAVVWTAEGRKTTGWILLRDSQGQETLQQLEPAVGRYLGVFQDLKAGATYEYEIYNAGLFGRQVRISGPHHVTMPPARDKGAAFRFVAFGDSGVGGNSQTIVAELIAAQKPQVIIHLGDLVYPAGSPQDYPLNFYEPNRSFLPTIPFLPCLGNHDVATETGRPMLREFVLPQNGPPDIEAERNYYFDYANARFVALDTNLDRAAGAISEAQMKTTVASWLRTVLTDCDATWKFVYFHHPIYTGSQHRPEGTRYIKTAFLSIFEEAGVDMVLCGHNHLYERTAPMRGDQIVEDGKGIVHITSGAGGAQRYPELHPPPAYIRRYNDRDFSFTCIDITDSTCTLRQIDETGKAFDEYVIRKERPTA